MKDGWFQTGAVATWTKRASLHHGKKERLSSVEWEYVRRNCRESHKQSELVSQVVVIGAGRKQAVA